MLMHSVGNYNPPEGLSNMLELMTQVPQRFQHFSKFLHGRGCARGSPALNPPNAIKKKVKRKATPKRKRHPFDRLMDVSTRLHPRIRTNPPNARDESKTDGRK